MMGFWQPLSNLRDYASQNPPAVTFFLCLGALAISFICIGFYSYSHILPNPDIANDWNHLLSSLSQLQLCVSENSSEHVSAAPSHVKEQIKETESSVDFTEIVTYLHLKVPLVVTSTSAIFTQTYLGLHTTLKAKQLNIGGNEIVDVTIEFPPGESGNSCLTISAPAHILPMTLLPSECPAFEKNVTFIYVEASDQLHTAAQTCYSLQSKYDPGFTVMLTKEDQSVAVQHLLEVSICLLGICFLFCLTAVLTHSTIRHYQWNKLDQQNEPLIKN